MGTCEILSQYNYLIASAIMAKPSVPSASSHLRFCEMRQSGSNEIIGFVNRIKDSLGLVSNSSNSPSTSMPANEGSLNRKHDCCIFSSRSPQCPPCDFHCSSACIQNHQVCLEEEEDLALSEDDDESLDSDDEFDMIDASYLAEAAKIAEAVIFANKKWNFHYVPEASQTERNFIGIKVCFPEADLVSVHYLDEEEESKEARRGTWLQEAADRQRFEDRIKGVEKVLAPILSASHREKMYQLLHDN